MAKIDNVWFGIFKIVGLFGGIAVLGGLGGGLAMQHRYDVSQREIVRSRLWEMVAGDLPMTPTPEGKLAQDIRTLYIEPSNPFQRMKAIERLTTRDYPGISIAEGVYKRIYPPELNTKSVHAKIAKIIARQKPAKEENR